MSTLELTDVATPDYVLVGHVCRDVLGQTERPGGTVLYAGVTALRLGRRVGIVTSHGPDLVLPEELAEAQVINIFAPETTTFLHQHEPTGRVLTLTARAGNITIADVPVAWRTAQIIHFAPVAWEVDRDVGPLHGASMLVATPQGWLRRATDTGNITPAIERLASLPMEALTAVVVSSEDVGEHEQLVAAIAARCPVVAVTRGPEGCTLYTGGVPAQIPSWAAHEADSTGAGDVFATAFFIRLSETGDPAISARFAACVAARSVEGEGVARIPTRQQVEHELAQRAPR